MAVAGALAMPAVALAQVTVFGTIDGGLRLQNKAIFGAGDERATLGTDGLRTTNRWGLRGSEALGGGLMANFWMEGQYGSDTGALGSSPATGNGPTLVGTTGSANVNQGLFQRKVIVGLSQGGNSVDIGRDYTVNFKSQGIYDPMSYTYTGVTPSAGTNTAGVRSSNMVTAGFRFGPGGVRVDYVMGEGVGVDTGDRIGLMGDFAFGPVTITGAVSDTDTSPTTKAQTINFGGAFRFGAFTIRAGYSDTETETGPGTDTNSPMILLGVQYAISPTLNARAGYYDTSFETNGTETGSRKVGIIALDYILSKRTIAYFAFDRTSIDGTASNAVLGIPSRDGATALSVGVAHTF